MNSEPFASAAALMAAYRAEHAVCILTDVMLGASHGFDAAGELRSLDPAAAIVFMTAWPATSDAVDAIRRHGGVDYLEKPIDVNRLLASVEEGLQWSARRRRAELRLKSLSARERQILHLLADGKSSKVIAAELNLSPKTIEDHRASIRAKTGAGSLQELIGLLR
jgi:FixJ family two-component response regulator